MSKLLEILKKINFGTELELPFMQGYAINEVIKRYEIPAIKWGWGDSFIGVETKKQFIVWNDHGTHLEFLGLINKDGMVEAE